MKRSLLVAMLLASLLAACSDKQADVDSTGAVNAPATEEMTANQTENATTESAEVTTENEAAATEQEEVPAETPAAESETHE